jgi:hypothetical protein
MREALLRPRHTGVVAVKTDTEEATYAQRRRNAHGAG